LRELVLYSTYDEYVSDLREFLAVHIPYLKETFAKKAGIGEGPDPGPGPKIPDFDAKKDVYYTISNIGSGTFVDVNLGTETVCANSYNEESESQQWLITPLKNGYMFITNRATGYALNDPTEGEPTATTLTGTQLNTVPADSLDERQQWDIVSQEQGRYNLVNRFSEHAANLSGGGTDDGTAILSYTSDERNSSSNNRLWFIEEARNQSGNIIEGLEEDTDYALAYDSQSGRLHFGADNLEAFTFPVRIYDQSGRLVTTFQASHGTSLSQLPRGLYIITWNAQGRQKSVKLVR
ncbi:MAG: RICIN domain-containing protein, partial [Bacteroidales bacterium]|nr:RICIN domain-containing protein [Bacteroidales bacterium]